MRTRKPKVDRDELIERLTLNAVDSMDFEGLVQYAKEKLMEWYEKQSTKTLLRFAESELLEYAKDEEDDELVVQA